MDPTSAAVLLDIDGTLIDSTYHHALAWHRAFARHAEPPPLWRLHRAIGMGGDKLVGHVADEETEERLGDRLRDGWREEYAAVRGEVRPLPGARDLVRALRDQGYRVALASSGDPEFSREAVDLIGIADDIDLLTTAEDVDESKPEPDLLGETIRRLRDQGAEVQHAVLVGDTVYDVESASRAGLACVGVLTGGVSETELRSAGAVQVAEAPRDLVGLDWPAYLSAVR
ncbi:HAD-IA family hydrolase [Nocardioides sp. MAH-18]|uniref:HAD-IA family hydrolase n=1 Tax=Nocardioides agri TaxID=2682843 RepID=A0A6L6XRC5_9ACTN|nr:MULTISPECIES: HAD family hydrolase [unclassified Nocardioides]MBA2953277.1 HAD family hydrolase [Nocardioides sp. CGMCC 1.13656]MVQ48145.1 HAD-IA family hydrolase [Nocardioides sp. MAH-18]